MSTNLPGTTGQGIRFVILPPSEKARNQADSCIDPDGLPIAFAKQSRKRPRVNPKLARGISLLTSAAAGILVAFMVVIDSCCSVLLLRGSYTLVR